jgi:anti-sigma B factor antagonist
MSTTINEYKRCTLVTFEGRIDSNTVPAMEETLKGITDAGQFKIALDMSKVTFVSSAGWWMLIETQKHCHRYNRGELVMAGLDERIRKSLDLVGMGSYFKIFDDAVTAVAYF